MRVVVLAIGSRGDVQPYVALALGLQRAGHRVAVATHEPFRELVTERGLELRPVGGNPREIVESEAGQAWLRSGRNPIRFYQTFVRLARPMMERGLADTWVVCRDAEAIVYSALGWGAYSVAERLGIPSFPALLQPATRTRAFPGVGVPPRPRLGGALNSLSYLVGEQLSWQPFRASVNRWRRETLGLPPIPVWGPYPELRRRRLPYLYGFSRQVVPKPADWPAWHHVTGYWFLDRPADWKPPAELADFLAAGPPPVYVGFGSMKPRDAVASGRLAVAALRRAGRRGVLLTGWSGLRAGRDGDDVLIVDEAPHDWLFPRMAAVVHHGGAGTTAAGLRAGVPSVVCPFFADQPFWGWRVADLGVGPPPIMQPELTVDRLAAAIRRAAADSAMAARAAALGERIRAEDGVARAVELFDASVKGLQAPSPSGRGPG